ncbi:MAG: translation elongation factor Ts, partial [Spirochaetia bacterium]|nr:translation elongation factor Ts [Spirochaetia bacterium]
NQMLSKVLENDYKEPNDELNQMVKDVISTIKENMSLKKFETMDVSENELVSEYTHGEGNIGVLVKMKAEKPEALEKQEVKDFLFDCALHVAAFNPMFLDKSDIDDSYKKEQEDIFKNSVAESGKPANVIDNIVKGKMNKHFSEICFLQQGFVKDDKNSVEKTLKELSDKVGSELNIVEYIYYRVGMDN